MNVVAVIVFSLGCHSTEKSDGLDDALDSGIESNYDLDWPVLDAFVETEMQYGNIPGMGIALVVGGDVVFSRGYGWANVESQEPVTANTPFMLASISKVFTGTALMQTRDSGLLSLDDPINSLLPYRIDNPKIEGEEILVKHLVTHSSTIVDRPGIWGGIGGPDSLYADGDSEIPLGPFMEGYLTEDGQWYSESNFSDGTPGETFQYSNMASALAGQLVEEASGVALPEHSNGAIFAPLGMDNTGWHLADLDPALVAMPYSHTDAGFEPYGHYGYPDYPDGQLRSSPSDLARFMASFIKGGALEEQRILTSETVEDMWAVQLPGLNPSQGIFWYWVNYWGSDMVGHNGSDYGVATEMLYDPAIDVAVIVLCNTGWGSGTTDAIDSVERYLFELGQGL